MNWSDEYRTGWTEVDRQHQRLFALFDEMDGALEGDADRRRLQATLQGLADYAVYHFATEEELLSDHPDLVFHQREHGYFMDRTRRFITDFQNSRKELSPHVSRFLRVWLKNHILGVDRAQLGRRIRGKPRSHDGSPGGPSEEDR